MTTQSPSPLLVIGIDVGTSGVRVIICDEHGEQVSMGSSPMPEPRNHPVSWWQACTIALTAAVSPIKDKSSVVALAVDGTSGTLLAIDERGNPVDDALMYNDQVGDKRIVEKVQRLAPDTSPARSATSGLSKALVLQQKHEVKHVIHQADWILGKLSGQFRYSDENNALKTGYDPVQRAWPNWITQTGMNIALLPEVKPVATPLTTLSRENARQFALSENMLLCSGTTDGCAAFLATGADESGDAVTSLGTTLTLKLLVEQPVFNSEYGVYSHRIGDLWLAGGASNTGGAVLQQYFTDEQLQQISQTMDTATLPQLNYYPLPGTGERFPINDPTLTAKLSPRPEDESEFLKGLFEGIAMIEKLGYDRVESLSNTPLRSLRTVGGGSKNSAWTSIRKKVIDVTFKQSQSTHAASGAAKLAWLGYKTAS